MAEQSAEERAAIAEVGGHPKPAVRLKARKPPKPRKPLPRSTKPIPQGKPPQRTGLAKVRRSPYQHPEWAKLRRQVHKRSRGICESCGNPGSEVHHKVYAARGTWRKLIVSIDDLIHLCWHCHRAQHQEKER